MKTFREFFMKNVITESKKKKELPDQVEAMNMVRKPIPKPGGVFGKNKKQKNKADRKDAKRELKDY